jgi:hypothetical protein
VGNGWRALGLFDHQRREAAAHISNERVGQAGLAAIVRISKLEARGCRDERIGRGQAVPLAVLVEPLVGSSGRSVSSL